MADEPVTVYIAGVNYGPYYGGFTPMGVYSTEEKAWAAMGKVNTTSSNEVHPVVLDAEADHII